MRWVKLTVLLLVLLLGAAFTVQNSTRTTQLTLDLGFVAWRLVEPAPVPWVMGGCFVAGVLVAAAAGLRKRMELGRRVRQLEQELALRGATPPARDEKGGWS